ncbi:ATP-binding cassette domain-containing protein, partial [Ilumatobacter sp.]|uniref:ATP-binding cassette domain-containing protein n=1 Tax=Ilumatobacter sp. TaxID=1967498 RepID=UPI003C6986FF
MSGSSGALEVRIRLARADFTIDVDIEVAAGTTAALLGPNGAGKSSILSSIAGLVDVPDGSDVSVRLGDRVLSRTSAGTWVPPEARHVGIVFQEHRLFDHLSVLDNVAFGPRSAGARTRPARAEAERWIELLGLG